MISFAPRQKPQITTLNFVTLETKVRRHSILETLGQLNEVFTTAATTTTTTTTTSHGWPR